ncbi:hypothetical protein BU15DRAFT_59279 [Melanogaster broomeanus]|nr:hypothetical protein BU15DRAFT_59279 [Melanogaster broomeanus]
MTNFAGDRYVDADWRPALAAVIDAEGDVAAAMKAIEPLALYDAADAEQASKSVFPRHNHLLTTQPCIRGAIITRGDPRPCEEREISSSGSSAGVATDKAIAALVRWETVAAHGDVIEVDSDSDDDEDPGPTITRESREGCRTLSAARRRMSGIWGCWIITQVIERIGYFELTYDGSIIDATQTSLDTYFTRYYVVCTV